MSYDYMYGARVTVCGTCHSPRRFTETSSDISRTEVPGKGTGFCVYSVQFAVCTMLAMRPFVSCLGTDGCLHSEVDGRSAFWHQVHINEYSSLP